MTTPLEISTVTGSHPLLYHLCALCCSTNTLLLSVNVCVTPGFYLALKMSGDIDGDTAVLSAPVNIQAPTMCVRFSYFMLGPSVGNLDLVVKSVRKNKVFFFLLYLFKDFLNFV